MSDATQNDFSEKPDGFNPPESEKRNLEMLRDESTRNFYDDQNEH